MEYALQIQQRNVGGLTATFKKILTVVKARSSDQLVGTAGAALAVAGLGGFGLQRLVVLTHQMGLRHTHIEMIPGRDLVQTEGAVVVNQGQCRSFERLDPAVVVEILLPCVKEGAVLKCSLDHTAQTAVTLGKHALQHAGGAVVVVDLDLAGMYAAEQVFLLFLQGTRGGPARRTGTACRAWAQSRPH